VDGARRLGIDMAGKAASGASARNEGMKSLGILGAFRVELRQRAFNPEIGQYTGYAMPASNDVNHVEVMLLDETIQVRVDQRQCRTSAPVRPVVLA